MKLVYIEWLDAQSKDSGWAPLDELEPELYKCKSVGWLAAENDKAVTLVANLGPDDPNLVRMSCHNITIPKSLITKRRILR